MLQETFENNKRVIRRLTRRTYNTMDKRKETTEQTMIYSTLHRKLKIEQHEPNQEVGMNTHRSCYC